MDRAETADQMDISRRRSGALVGAAVQRNSLFSVAGLNERAFTFAFSNLVYPQIWRTRWSTSMLCGSNPGSV